MKALEAAFALVCVCLVAACPNERKDLIEEVGGAPKQQLEHVQKKLDRAAQDVSERLNRATEATDE